ncbi:MAG: NAD(P)-dependent oxidoreductase [Actinobacteria bacterium]|nr:NAD(P)-dependent oxidoreductase [Actinomycetota bacterium]
MLVLGAGYVGAKLAELALDAGEEVVLADNWYATRRGQLAPLEERGAQIETADIRSRADLARLFSLRPARVYLLAAQASRPIAEREPDYTEETNVAGVRRVAEAAAENGAPPLVFASSLNVYGRELAGEITAERPYGDQGDLAHLTKVYGELCLGLFARRAGFDLAVLRLGIVYGPSRVEHDTPDSQTVVDKFRRLAARGEHLPLDDDGRATIGVVHVEDAARIMLSSPASTGVTFANVAAETITVADVAALIRGEEPAGAPAFTVASPFTYEQTLRDYLRP